MGIQAGTRLGLYEVVSAIGAGGMGEVYRAHDTKLGRDVAVKVLPEQFAQDPERLARFQREAKLLAALNHPNIATIHGLEQSGETHYLVMELVPGETLHDRILREGALPVEEALTISRQIAEALDAAHGSEKGIIHRDLKPANVKITPEGRVKVLDFGLAKAYTGEPAGREDFSNSPTLSVLPTMPGTILGTAAYMSPEQVRGRRLDKRTDIWSFGCVLYEMLGGKPIFRGESTQDILAAVLQRELDWNVLPETVPPSIRALLRHCLQRDVNRRARDAGDLCFEIDEALAECSMPQSPAVAVAPVSRPPLQRTVLPWTVAALAVLSAIVLAFFALSKSSRGPLPNPKVSRFSISIPSQQRIGALNGLSLAVSPDGTLLVYVGIREGVLQLYLRPLDSVEAKPIAESEGATGPFFSPDGRWIAFFAAGKLKKVPVAGGAALALADAVSSTGGTWGPDNTILFGSTTSSPIYQVSADGGTPKAVTQLDRSQGETNHISPQFLPGGDAFVYAVWTGFGPDESYLRLHSLRSREDHKLVHGATSQGFYLAPGYLAFIRSGALMATHFDLATMKISADPAIPVIEGILEAPLTSNIALSTEGTLAYIPGFSALARKTRIVEVDRQGHVQPLSAPTGVYYTAPRFSPDGKTIAFATLAGTAELWTYDLARGTPARLSGGPGGLFPIWSADGKSITYVSFRHGERGIYSRLADGTGQEDALTAGEQVEAIDAWSADGARLAFHKLDPASGGDIWLLDARTRQTRPLLNGPFNEIDPALSPDGHWMAYVSDESGRREIYVQPFPGTGPKRQISTEGGTEPIWPRNSHELFFRSGNKTMAVDVRVEPVFTSGVPRVLFEGDFYRGSPYSTYDVSSDGQRFLLLQAVEADPPANQINVVLNFAEELRRRLPTGSK